MLIKESKRDNFLNSYVELLRSKGIDINLSQLKSLLLSKFSSEFGIYALSKSSNYYLAGVSRYYFEGLLTSNKRLNIFYPKVTDKPIGEICKRLNALIEILRNSYIDSVGTKFEQPEDFGTLSLDKLLKKYNKKINEELGISDKPKKDEDTQKIDSSTKAGKKYTYEIIYDYDQVRKFSEYTKPGAWCITYAKQHYNAYIKRLGIHYVIFMKKGFENIPRKVGKGFSKKKPHDEYGNSLICVLQSNRSPEPVFITSRWNHGYERETAGTEADHAYTTQEFLDIIGEDYSVLERCFAQWKENTKSATNKDTSNLKKDKLFMKREFKYIQMMIANGSNLKQELIKRNARDANFLDKEDKSGGDPWKKPLKIGLRRPTGTNEHGYEQFEIWYTIYDRGKFYVDNILIKDFMQTHTLNDTLVMIEGDKKHYFYNIKKHFLLNADGVYSFKSTGYGYGSDSYLMVANGPNAYSIIDLQKGDFLKAPNGATIFENAMLIQTTEARYPWARSSSNKTVIDSHIGREGKLFLVYDSSAQISFLFDLKTNQFIRCFDGVEEDGITWKISTGNVDVVDGYTLYYTFRDNYLYMLKNNNTGEKLSLLGYSIFTQLDLKECGVIAFRPYDPNSPSNPFDRKCYFFDTILNDYLKLNGEIVFGAPIYHNTDFLVIGDPKSNNKYVLLYNPLTRSFYHIGDEYYFEVADDYTHRVGTLRVAIAGSKYFKNLTPESAKEEMQESIKNKFYTLLEKLL